jgi:hypothetical protein
MSILKHVFVIALSVVILSIAVVTPTLADGSTSGRTSTIYTCWTGNAGFPLNDTHWVPALYRYDLFICKVDGGHYCMSWGYENP